MLGYGLQKHLEKLEEVGAAATKEYSLEKAMEKMVKDWAMMEFIFLEYRDTGISILSAVDDVQVLLDDHIVKTQTMRGSPFIKPFEEDINEVVGFELKPSPDTPLSTMLGYGLQKHLEKLEEVGAAATKEYSLEKAMEKMVKDWAMMEFIFLEYRDTGISILSAVDDVQVLLDDHIVKTQTMRGSPFIKPFEEDIKQWEQKLMLIQDIMDAWLKCQATWLYLGGQCKALYLLTQTLIPFRAHLLIGGHHGPDARRGPQVWNSGPHMERHHDGISEGRACSGGDQSGEHAGSPPESQQASGGDTERSK
jgi:hypothetical protein